jgi:hypothetical protein
MNPVEIIVNAPAVVEVQPVAAPATVEVFSGPLTINGGSDDKTYSHNQSSPSAVWSITHNLGKKPSVAVFDSAGDQCFGEINHTSNNSLTITFSASFSGAAYLN